MPQYTVTGLDHVVGSGPTHQVPWLRCTVGLTAKPDKAVSARPSVRRRRTTMSLRFSQGVVISQRLRKRRSLPAGAGDLGKQGIAIGGYFIAAPSDMLIWTDQCEPRLI